MFFLIKGFLDRQNNEEIVKIKNMSSDGKIPKGLLSEGTEAIKDGYF